MLVMLVVGKHQSNIIYSYYSLSYNLLTVYLYSISHLVSPRKRQDMTLVSNSIVMRRYRDDFAYLGKSSIPDRLFLELSRVAGCLFIQSYMYIIGK